MNTETTVEIDVLLELRDYLRANYWFMFRRFKWLLLLLFFGAIVYPLLLVSKIALQDEVNNYWGYFIPWVLLALMFGGTYFTTKKQMASNRALNERIHYIFSESGLATNASTFSGQTAWANVYETHETKTNFLIFISKTMMYIIPKRCFDSAEQIASFKRLLRSQLDAKAKWK